MKRFKISCNKVHQERDGPPGTQDFDVGSRFYPIKVRAGMLRPKVQILNTSLFTTIKLLYFLLAICGYPRHWPVMGQGLVELYYGTVFLTQLLKKPRISTEKPINKTTVSWKNLSETTLAQY